MEVFFIFKANEKSYQLRKSAALAMLVAISIILGKYLALSIGEVLRFSLENLPIIFAGIVFGPLSAILVAVTADLVGCLLVGYAINPIVTLGAATIAAVAGIVPRVIKKHSPLGEKTTIALAIILSHLFGSVLIKTVGLAVFYDMPIFVLMLWRLLNYTIISVCEFSLITVLLNRDGVRREIDKLTSKSK